MDDTPVVVKKYANRRLYNTATSSYVTLEQLSEMVKRGEEFVVRDAKSGEDITRAVLTQIIFEEEAKGQSLLPISFLQNLIRFYGDQVEAVVPSYLAMAMDQLIENQDRMREQMSKAFDTSQQPLKLMEDIARQNAALVQQSWQDAVRQMFTLPGTGTGQATAPEQGPHASREGAGSAPASADEIASLKAQLLKMQAQLDQLTEKK